MLYIIILFWAVFCYLKVGYWIKKREICNLRLKVQMIKIITKKPVRGSELLQKPILKVCSREEDKTINSAIYTHLFTLEIGEELWIRVNPLDFEDFMYESPYSNRLILADAMGTVVPLIGLILFLLLF